MDASNAIAVNERGRWAVASIFLVNGFLVGSWAPQIPLVLTRLSITESVLGLLILCFGIGALLSMPWCGWLIAQYGERRVLRVGGLLQGLGLLMVVLSPSVAVTAVAMAVFGALIGCTDVAMNAATVSVERRLGRAVMSSMHGFWSLGGFAGAGLGGLLLQAIGPVPHAALVGVASVAVAVVAIPHLVGAAPQRQEGSSAAARRSLSIPRHPTVYLLGLMALILFSAEGAVLDWGALYMNQERSATLALAGLAYAFFAGAMALMRFLGDGVRNRYGAVPTLRACSLIAAAAMLAAALAPHPVLVIIAFTLCGMGVANTVPIVFSAGGNLPGLASGTGMSVVTTMGYSGVLLAPAFIGFVAERTGFAVVFAVFAGLLVVVGLMSSLAAPADSDHGGENQSGR